MARKRTFEARSTGMDTLIARLSYVFEPFQIGYATAFARSNSVFDIRCSSNTVTFYLFSSSSPIRSPVDFLNATRERLRSPVWVACFPQFVSLNFWRPSVSTCVVTIPIFPARECKTERTARDHVVAFCAS
jgi:hypothetical protein